MDVKEMVREIARARDPKSGFYIEEVTARGADAIPELIDLAANRLERTQYRKLALAFVSEILQKMSEKGLPWARHWIRAMPKLEQIVRKETEHVEVAISALDIMRNGARSIEEPMVKIKTAAVMAWAADRHPLRKVRRKASQMLDDIEP